MGFYSASEWSARRPLTVVPQCGACGLYKQCNSPQMKVFGQGRRKVLILGEAPGANEDQRGRPFVGASGQYLAQTLRGIGVTLDRDCWITNSLICRPTDRDGNNRSPEEKELNFCRPNLANALEELKPVAVVPMGAVALRSLLPLVWHPDPKVQSVDQWAGWDIPCQSHNVWVCPTYHPAYCLYEADNVQLHVLMQRHLRQAFGHEEPPYKVKPDYGRRVRILFDDKQVGAQIESLSCGNHPLAFDFETTTLKPDSEDARILCCSVSDGKTSVAFPWHGKAIAATRKMVRSDNPKIGFNLKFEERWVYKEFGCQVKNWVWDGMLGAHWLDCRSGITGLKFQAFVRLGVEDYSSHLEQDMETDSGNDVNNLRNVNIAQLLRYCALDSYFEYQVARLQMTEGRHPMVELLDERQT